MIVYLVFMSKVDGTGDRNVFGVYSTERKAYEEADRLEATGRWECSVLSTPVLN